MEIADLYPYWERERQALILGLRKIERELKKTKSDEEVEAVWNWTPPTWPRSINDLLRHTAYVEHYIIEKLIMDQEPKTILPGSLLPAEDYPTFEDCIKLMHDVHDTTMIAFAGLTRDDLSKSILAFRHQLPIERLLWSIQQEEAHHRGQIYMLLRMQEIAPPERKD